MYVREGLLDFATVILVAEQAFFIEIIFPLRHAIHEQEPNKAAESLAASRTPLHPSNPLLGLGFEFK